MATEIRIYPEHVASLRRGLQALEGERSVCERWGIREKDRVELSLAIEDLAELIAKASEVVGEPVVAVNRRRPW